MRVKISSSNSSTLLLALEEIKASLPSNPNFTMVALSNNFPEDDVIPYIKEVLGTENFVAFQAIDAFKDTSIVKGITVCAFYFSNCGKASIKEIWNYRDEDAVKELSSSLNPNNLHIFLGVPNDSVENFIEKVSQNINYGPINNFIGGLSSGCGEKACIYTPQGKIEKGGVVISFENFQFQIGIALGFKPYGATYTINRAQHRRIYEVDYQSAVSLFERLLKGIEEEKKRILWYAPLYLIDDKEGYVATLRTPSEITKEYIELFGEIKTGDRFKLSFAFPEDLLQESKKVAQEVKAKMKRVELTLNFSCVARQFVLGDKGEKELEIYSSELNSHLFGFFTYGEIGPDRKLQKLKLYNETSLIVAMRESCHGERERTP